MYSFLLSEVWWMNTIIAALITALATMIASAILYRTKLEKIYDKEKELKEDHKGLTQEHKALAQEHKALNDLMQKNMQFAEATCRVADKIESRQVHEIEERAKLTATMPDEKSILDAVQAMFANHEREEKERLELLKENEKLKQTVLQLRNEKELMQQMQEITYEQAREEEGPEF